MMNLLSEIEFADSEPFSDEERKSRFFLGFSEVCIHTEQSFVGRVAKVSQLADREGVVLLDISAGLVAEP
jgi:hypothetical protein